MSARMQRSRRARRSAARRYAEYAVSFLLLMLLLIPVARLDQVSSRTISGRPVVNDADTLTIGAERMRLKGIDGPERDQSCMREGGTAWPCGREATRALQRLIGFGPVACEGWQRDRYGRLLVTCTSGETNLNRTLVAEGWAVAYGDYADAEAEARQAQRGLWSGPFERPADWRLRHGSLAESEHDRFSALWRWLAQVYAGSWFRGEDDEAL